MLKIKNVSHRKFAQNFHPSPARIHKGSVHLGSSPHCRMGKEEVAWKTMGVASKVGVDGSTNSGEKNCSRWDNVLYERLCPESIF